MRCVHDIYLCDHVPRVFPSEQLIGIRVVQDRLDDRQFAEDEKIYYVDVPEPSQVKFDARRVVYSGYDMSGRNVLQ